MSGQYATEIYKCYERIQKMSAMSSHRGEIGNVFVRQGG